MSELAEVFELAHRAREAFRSVRATIRTWRDEELFHEAFARFHEQQAAQGTSATMYAFAESDEEEPSETEEVTRLWLEGSRWREEVEGRFPRTLVTDGERAWWWNPSMGAIEQPESERLPETGAFLHPARLLAGLELEPLGRTTVRGREAVQVRARPRPRASWDDFGDFDIFGVPLGADEYELALDAERGVLLRATASLRGRVFATAEILEVAFDEEFPPETFLFVPPPGEVMRRPEEAFGQTEHDLTLEEAVERVDFPLWVPARMPPGWELDVVLYVPGHDRPPMPEQIFIHYWHEREGQLNLNERRADEPVEPGRRWEEVERDGQRLLVWEPEGRLPVPVQVRLEREGTRIELSSAELERDRLLELAVSLVRAPTEPPSLLRDG